MDKAARTTPGSAGRTAGAGAMFVASIVMIAVRIGFGVPTLPELFSDTIIFLIPATVFSALLDTLQEAAKLLLLAGLFLGQIGVGALVGQAFAAGYGSEIRDVTFGRAVRPALWICAGAWVLTLVVLMPIFGVGILGADTPAGGLVTMAGYAVSFATYGVVLAWLLEQLVGLGRAGVGSRTVGRRAVLAQLGWGIVGVALAGLGLRVLSVATGSGQDAGPAKLPSPLTPVSSFYVVSKNLFGVNVDLARWQLTVMGSGARLTKLSLPDIKAMPTTELDTTLTCISNLIGGDLIGTARWTGVRLRDLIGVPSPGENIQDVILTGWDNYADSIPIAKALDPNTLVVYAIDGQPLPPEHGFPLRLIVPGLYGIKNVKWLTRIEVSGHGFVGYWPSRGWTDVATVQTESQIDVPRDHSSLPLGPNLVGGIAFAGDRGISGVELSTDGGNNWKPVTMQPPLSPFTWTTWTTMWTPPSAGQYHLVVRATDGTGQLQSPVPTDPVPNGATGYHQITVRVG